MLTAVLPHVLRCFINLKLRSLAATGGTAIVIVTAAIAAGVECEVGSRAKITVLDDGE